jgi:hypothetical protein
VERTKTVTAGESAATLTESEKKKEHTGTMTTRLKGMKKPLKSLRPIFVEALKTPTPQATVNDVRRGSSWEHGLYTHVKVTWATVLCWCQGT